MVRWVAPTWPSCKLSLTSSPAEHLQQRPAVLVQPRGLDIGAHAELLAPFEIELGREVGVRDGLCYGLTA